VPDRGRDEPAFGERLMAMHRFCDVRALPHKTRADRRHVLLFVCLYHSPERLHELIQR
jgi:hypothetical protein